MDCTQLLSAIGSAARFRPRRLSALIGLAISLALSSAFGQSGDPGAGNAAPVPFAALHLYYISKTGDDYKAGTSPATAWKTPRHPVNCGDVILVEPGTYDSTWAFGQNNWGEVSNCPSWSGGIDGKGGVYFAVVLCAGPHLGSCNVTSANGPDFRVDRSNWAIEGFSMTQPGGGAAGANGCASATSESAATQHHIAFINNVAVNCNLSGFGSYSWTLPGGGVDQFAVVGAITYNDAASLNSGGLCASGVAVIPVGGPDPSEGTHVFVAGNFGYQNVNAPSGAGCNTDGEGLIFDSWACSNYVYQGVAEQNVWWANGSAGFEIFPNCLNNGDKAKIYAFGNTSYGNQRDPVRKGAASDLMINQLAPTSDGGGFYDIFDNIFVTTKATSGDNASTPVYTAGVALNNNNVSLVKIDHNVIWQSNPGSVVKEGNPNTDVWIRGYRKKTSFPFGINDYKDPVFANAGALATEAPDCANYTNTTACMNQGYHVAANLTPKAAAGYGYVAPGPCKSDPFFPIWLKGVVFLRWNGSSLTENPGLITKPCDL